MRKTSDTVKHKIAHQHRRTRTQGKIGPFICGVFVGGACQWWSILLCVSYIKFEAYSHDVSISILKTGNESSHASPISDVLPSHDVFSSSLLQAEDSSLSISGVFLVSLCVLFSSMFMHQILSLIVEAKTGRRLNTTQLISGTLVGSFLVAFFRPYGLYDKKIVRIFGFLCFGLVSFLGFVDTCTTSTWHNWGFCQLMSKEFVRSKLCRYDCNDEEEISYCFDTPKTKVVNLDGKVLKLQLRDRSPSPCSFPKDRKRCYIS